MTENKRLYDVINKAEPRGQSVTYEGIPCTARTCVTRLNRLTEENEQLKQSNQKLNDELQETMGYLALKSGVEKENEELKQRNDRQAKQLDRIYQLIEEKDWRTLNDILDDFKQCEEQLQREWRTYE